MKYVVLYIAFFSGVTHAQWNLISPAVGLDHSYTDVHFINQDTGFVIGVIQGNGGILRTTNGGVDWDTTLIYDVTGTILMAPYAITFPNDSIGYIAGTWHLIKTVDCGATWFEIDLGNTYENTIAAPDVIFINKDTGFVGWADGGAGCLRTFDGGISWSPDPILPSVRSFNSYNGNYFAGTGGWAYLDLTTLTWQSYANNITPDYHYVSTLFLNGKVIVIGDKMGGSAYGIYAISDDLGANWTVNYVSPGRLKGIELLNDTLWQMCGILDGTLRSYDAGESWHYTTVDDFETGMYKWFSDFSFVNDTVGFAISQNGIYKTTNGGGASVGDATFFPHDLGTKENDISGQFLVYPNPVQNEINFSGTEIESAEILIYALDGKEILRKQNLTENKLDLSGLPSGNYIIKFILISGVYSTQFIKE